MPVLPLGAHREPMRPDADLSLRGIALLLGELLEHLDLRDVTVVQNDWGGVQVLLANGGSGRISRLVLTSCEAFDNYPPRIALPLVRAARVPGGLWLVCSALRLRLVQRAPGSWGWMSRCPVAREVISQWFRPAARSSAIRRDLAKYLLSVPSREVLMEWSERASTFDGPVLVVWARLDRVMPVEHATRLASQFPRGSLTWADDSYTLIPVDRPDVLVDAIEEFVR